MGYRHSTARCLSRPTNDRGGAAAGSRRGGRPALQHHDHSPHGRILPAAATAAAQVNLLALLTADGQRIDQGLVWRIYEDAPAAKGETKLLMTMREPSPTVSLSRATTSSMHRFRARRPDAQHHGDARRASMSEKFVLNAGGLRAKVLVDGKAPPPNTVSYDIFSGERDQSDNRTKVMSHAKPNIVIRLNAGIYRIVSTYGDANATVEADVTVEAGKLTEATITHSAARVTFKLVTELGGEALARYAMDRADARRASGQAQRGRAARRTSWHREPTRSSQSRARAPSSATLPWRTARSPRSRS